MYSFHPMRLSLSAQALAQRRTAPYVHAPLVRHARQIDAATIGSLPRRPRQPPIVEGASMNNQAMRRLVPACALALAAGSAVASSHRESPALTAMPKVDATDLYMFRSYEAGRQDYVTFIANYQPFQDPQGG